MNLYRSIARCIVIIPVLLAAFPASARYFEEKDVVSSPWYTGLTGNATINSISTDDWMHSSAGKATLGYHGFIIEDDQVTALVYEIANRLLQNWPGSVPQMVIFVQGEASPTTYGAATTDAREIFLFYGVLLNAQSEDELAAVIAHELGHILLDHVKSLDYRKNMRSTIAALGQARDFYSTAQATHYDKRSNEIEIDPEISEGLRKSANQQMLANDLYDSAHATLFSRANEFDADRFAIDLLLASGYSPMGLKTSLERLAHSYDLSNAISYQLKVSSSQLKDKYTTQLNEELGERDPGRANYSDTINTLKGVFGAAASEFGNTTLDVGKSSILNMASRSHPVTEDRLEHFSQYLQENYQRKQRRKRENLKSAKRFRSGVIGNVVTNYRAANEAVVAVRLQNNTEAQRLISVAISKPTEKHSYPHYAAFSLKSNAGTVTIDDVNAVHQHGIVPIHASLLMVNALASADEYGQAIDTATKTESRFGEIADFYPVKIKGATAAGDQVEAERLAHACFEAEDVSSTLTDRCAHLAGIEKSDAAGNSIEAASKLGKSLMDGAMGLFNKDK